MLPRQPRRSQSWGSSSELEQFRRDLRAGSSRRPLAAISRAIWGKFLRRCGSPAWKGSRKTGRFHLRARRTIRIKDNTNMEQNFGGSVAGLMTGLLSDAAFFPRSHTAASTSKVRLPLGLRPVETLRRKPHKPMVRTSCGELIALASLVAGLLNSMTASSPVNGRSYFNCQRIPSSWRG